MLRAGGWDGDAEWGADAHRRVKVEVERRVRAELTRGFQRDVATAQRESRADAEVEWARTNLGLCWTSGLRNPPVLVHGFGSTGPTLGVSGV